MFFRGLGDRSFGIVVADSQHYLVYHRLYVDGSDNIDADGASGRQGCIDVVTVSVSFSANVIEHHDAIPLPWMRKPGDRVCINLGGGGR